MSFKDIKQTGIKFMVLPLEPTQSNMSSTKNTNLHIDTFKEFNRLYIIQLSENVQAYNLQNITLSQCLYRFFLSNYSSWGNMTTNKFFTMTYTIHKNFFVSVLLSGVYFFNNLSSVLLGYFQFPLMIFNYIFQNLRAVSFIIVDKQTTCKISYIFPLIC